jgi:hypothetical protein
MPDNKPTTETTPTTVTTTTTTKQVKDRWFFQLLDALSLSGAIMLMFFSITLYGITKNDEKVWTTGMTALTTFVSGKQLGKSEILNQK